MPKQRRVRQDWPAVVAAQASSGMNVSAFCRKQGIATSQFYRWRRRGRSGVPPAEERGFVELRAAEDRTSVSGVSLVLDGGWRLELTPGFDPPTLERVLACVARSGACSR